MTVNTTTSRIEFTGNGVTTVFAFPYYFLADADLVVIETVIATGVQTTKTLTTHYTVTGAGIPAGGSVTMLVAPASTVTLTIYRDPAATQEVDLVEGDPLPVETAVERPFDKLTMITQRVKELINRALRLPEGDTGFVAADMLLPAKVTRASKYLAFDANGKPIATAGTTDATVHSAFIATMHDDTTALAARTTLGLPLPFGVTYMVRTGDGTWSVYAPDGSAVDISTSTTDGLQEAINHASTNGHNLIVTGGSVTSGGSDVAVINCTSAITWPAMQGKTIDLGWCTINFTGAVTADGMVFDSCMMVHFTHRGQIVYQGNNDAVTFKPTSNVPLDAVKGIVDSNFYIQAVACIGGTNPTGVSFDSSTANAPIHLSKFEFGEINGDNAGVVYGQHGIRIPDPAGAGAAVLANQIICHHLHKFSGSSLKVGSSTGSQIYSNDFFANIMPNGASSIGVQTYCGNNNYNVALLSNEGTINTGIQLETTATAETFKVRQNDATIKVTDNSNEKSSEGAYGNTKPRASVHRNNVDQTAIPTATWTKVQWTTETFDNGGKFDSATNYRWTPGRLGRARISANSAWATTVDATLQSISVYKNGTAYRNKTSSSSGTGGAQGAFISALVDVTAVTDYFEIFVRQDTGGNRDLSGQIVDTWAMFEMVDG